MFSLNKDSDNELETQETKVRIWDASFESQKNFCNTQDDPSLRTQKNILSMTIHGKLIGKPIALLRAQMWIRIKKKSQIMGEGERRIMILN